MHDYLDDEDKINSLELEIHEIEKMNVKQIFEKSCEIEILNKEACTKEEIIKNLNLNILALS